MQPLHIYVSLNISFIKMTFNQNGKQNSTHGNEQQFLVYHRHSIVELFLIEKN